LRAAPTVMEARVAAREQGVLADRYGARVRVLERLLDEAAVEEFTLRTDDASVTT